MTVAWTRTRTTAAAVGGGPSRVSPRPVASLTVLFVGLMLYAAFGKGFAYAGWPPVFVGEGLLVIVLASAVRPWASIPRNPAALVAAALVGLGIVQVAVDRLVGAVPLMETLRGLAPLYYSTYAFGVYALLRAYEQQAGRAVVLNTIDRAMARTGPWIVSTVTALAALLLIEPAGLPTWPTSGVELFFTKSGDIAVTLVLFAPVLFDLRVGGRIGGHRLALIGMWCSAALLVMIRSRGALLALVAGLLVARPHPVRMVKALMAVATTVLVLYVTGLSVEVSGRELSFAALGDAVQSVVGGAPEDQASNNYVGTTNWRAEWWEDIWTDVRQERMVLHGHGWGDNLAARYGVTPATADQEFTALRLPHNIFFSLAGRVGLVTAIALVVVVPILTISPTFSGRAGLPVPPMIQAARGAVAAALVTGLTDIYLESPQGGILFWSLVGFLWWACAPAAGREAAQPVAQLTEG